MQIELTVEDEEAINRLMALGFPRGAAIQVGSVCAVPRHALSPCPTTRRPNSQAFLACDKDEHPSASRNPGPILDSGPLTPPPPCCPRRSRPRIAPMGDLSLFVIIYTFLDAEGGAPYQSTTFDLQP